MRGVPHPTLLKNRALGSEGTYDTTKELLMTAIRFATYFPCLACVAAMIVMPPVSAQAQAKKTPWGDPDLQGIWTNFDLGEGFSLEAPPPQGGRASRQLIGTGTCVPSDEEIPQASAPGSAGIGSPEHWFETSSDTVGQVRPSLISEPGNGRLPSLTKAGSDRIDNVCRKGFEDYIYLDPWVRCITRGIPASTFPSLYNNAYQIVQVPGYVVLRYEMIHDTRIIPISDGPLPESEIRLWMGRPRAYFENGNTLLVETTNFTDRSAIRGHAHTENLTVTERFTLTGDNELDYEAIVTDQETWVTPWKAAIGLTRFDEYSMFEYACHEGNGYAMRNMLSGARAEEAVAAAREEGK